MEAEAELDGALSDKERKCEERLLDGNSEVVRRYSSPSLGCCSLCKISSSVSFPGEIKKLNIWKGRSDSGGFESPEVRKKKIKNHLMCIYIYLVFNCLAKNILKDD
jgi:hypothetical protein